ncbi:MAG: DNA polymerase IV [Clostridia bacterium]|nr:DNA polymerase IV [Clostridia bacterium]
MDRVILHCDCNNFFASVESIDHPEYRCVPMAVAGDPSKRHGIILAKNEKAKAMGVQTAETIWQAQRKCPNLLLLPPHHEKYEEVSRRINAIYRNYTDLVEPFSIDESWLDVTGSQRLFGDGKTIADRLRKEVREKIGVTISVGVSFNKIFAKLGSDYKKPDATTVILPEDVPDIVWNLPVGDLFGVGRKMRVALENLGFRTIGNLAAADPDFLERRFGKAGLTLSLYARGLEDSPVRSEREPVKSVGNGTTYPKDLTERSEIYSNLLALSDSVASRLRKERKKGRTVQISVKDSMLTTVQRQKRLDRPTHLAKEIAEVSMELLESHWRIGSSPIRALTVTVSDLSDEDGFPLQYSLVPSDQEQQTQKQEQVELAMDHLRNRYGKNIILFGSSSHPNEEGDFHDTTNTE